MADEPKTPPEKTPPEKSPADKTPPEKTQTVDTKGSTQDQSADAHAAKAAINGRTDADFGEIGEDGVGH